VTELGTDAGAARQARLAAAVARLRTRGGDGSLDRWLLVVGGTLLPLGLLVIVLGWWGVSHKPQLYSQLSYLVSGGLLGLGLVFAGGFTYFAYWLTRLVREGREQSIRTADALARLEGLLAAGGAAPGAGVASGNGRATLVATATGSMVHRPDCPVVANRDRLVAVAADEPGYTPCKICEPLSG
jgi:hypothetical protein